MTVLEDLLEKSFSFCILRLMVGSGPRGLAGGVCKHVSSQVRIALTAMNFEVRNGFI